MLLAFDSYYVGNKAKTVALAFEHWQGARPSAVFMETLDGIADYEPGAFYKRELPCILSLLKRIPTGPAIKAIIVDGYVVLDDAGKMGLGAYLHEALEGKVPVIGVAKSSFQNNKKNVAEVLRGASSKPLSISSRGIDLTAAAKAVSEMHGDYRMPTLLQQLDTETKTKTIQGPE